MDGEFLGSLLDKLREVRQRVVEGGASMVARWEPMLSRGAFQESAVNLSHYVALRQLDLRPLQADLAPLGLSSLGHCEGRVLPTLDAIIANLEAMSRPGRSGNTAAVGGGLLRRQDACGSEQRNRVRAPARRA